MATYHMRSDGTAASKEAADGTGGASTFMSLTTHNSEASEFSSGDIIVLHDDAGAFTGTMDLRYSSGCTYQAYTGDSPKIENAGTCVDFQGASNVTWDGIDCEKTSGYAYMVIGSVDPGDDCTIKNCDISGADAYGIRLGDITGTNYYSGWVIEDNVLHDNVVAGINVMFRGSGCIIRRNEVYGNCTANGNYGGGIKLYGATTDISGIQVYDNWVHDNGLPAGTGNQGDGVGIWFDACLGASDDLNLIYDNLVVDNGGMGIFAEISSYCYIYSNVLIGNGFNSSGGNEFTPAHICVDSRTDGATPFVAEHNRVYNNSCYGGRGGLKCVAYNQTASWTHLTDNIFKNNIVSGTADEALICMGGGDNLTYGTGMVYDNNCLGAEATDFIFWGYGTHYSTYDAWEAAHGESWTQIEGDPLYTDPDNGDLTLQSSSPCIGAGENLGSPFDNGLLTTSTWPDGVDTGDRDSY